MSLQENYIFWRLTNYFLEQENYRLIHLHEEKHELWLENPSQKTRPVIRIQIRELGWTSVVERDVSHTFTVAENLRKQMGATNLQVANIYITPFVPVGEHGLFQDKVQNETEKITIQNLLVSSEQLNDHLEALEEKLQIPRGTFHVENEITDDLVVNERQSVITYITKKVNDEEQKARTTKPFVTYTFILMQMLYFIWVFLKDSQLSTYSLVEWGAKFNPLIYEGEWWRFISPIFLHTGFMHIAANCLMLYIVGPWAERLYGRWRYAVILLLGGIAGNIAGFALNNNVAVGSSTAVFALFGCLLYVVVLKPHLYAKTIGVNIAVLVGINLVLDLFMPNIDLAGHVGGLVGGFFLAGVLSLPQQYFNLRRGLYGAAVIILAGLFLFMGFNRSDDEADPALSNGVAQYYLQKGKPKEADKIFRYLDESGNADEYSNTLMAGQALQKQDFGEAKKRASEAVFLNNELPQPHYILAVCYMREGNHKEALKQAELAKNLSSEKVYQDFYNELQKNMQKQEGSL
ncbi:rhomboid family membrane protein [Listeria floridensis FSL S10-1187]|uniref:Rhomboid family membrane protein n=1 Tax=Listeria floridensis FSL S10-1187 TaxID=1265817 RepID=A0ABN0RF03_9LIST|nr:rhomboid family intramembrane serine protease [Listeria floridensis]EUJ31762.1 rhomboid family membrane protein [Listeria floridensis FSL S10-1187]